MGPVLTGDPAGSNYYRGPQQNQNHHFLYMIIFILTMLLYMYT